MFLLASLLLFFSLFISFSWCPCLSRSVEIFSFLMSVDVPTPRTESPRQEIRPHRRCWGVIFRMALVKGYRFTWGGRGEHFSAKTPVFLIGRYARLLSKMHAPLKRHLFLIASSHYVAEKGSLLDLCCVISNSAMLIFCIVPSAM